MTSAGRHVHMSRAISSLNEYGDRSNHRSEYQQDKEDAYDELRNERYENLQIDTYEPQREVVYDTLQNKPAESESDKHTYATFVISDVNFTRHWYYYFMDKVQQIAGPWPIEFENTFF